MLLGLLFDCIGCKLVISMGLGVFVVGGLVVVMLYILIGIVIGCVL